jgi:hypothetical protein
MTTITIAANNRDPAIGALDVEPFVHARSALNSGWPRIAFAAAAAAREFLKKNIGTRPASAQTMCVF